MKHAKPIAGLLLLSATSVAQASNILPQGAIQLSQEDTRQQFSGKTFIDGRYKIYFSTDGSVIGFIDNKFYLHTGQGKWAVNDNEFCYEIPWLSRKGPDGVRGLCARLYKADGQIIVQETSKKASSDLSVYPLSSFSLVSGDKVTKRYREIEKELGR